MNTEAQKAKILEYLRSGKAITPLEALDMFSCFRLGARCWDLRKDGIPVQSKMVQRNGKRFASYFLTQDYINERRA